MGALIIHVWWIGNKSNNLISLYQLSSVYTYTTASYLKFRDVNKDQDKDKDLTPKDQDKDWY